VFCCDQVIRVCTELLPSCPLLLLSKPDATEDVVLGVAYVPKVSPLSTETWQMLLRESSSDASYCNINMLSQRGLSVCGHFLEPDVIWWARAASLALQATLY